MFEAAAVRQVKDSDRERIRNRGFERLNGGRSKVRVKCHRLPRLCENKWTPPALAAWSCAPESARSQRGASPLQVNALRPVTECHCDAAMRGGEQQEVNDQSVG